MRKKLIMLFVLLLLTASVCIAANSGEFEGITIRTDMGAIPIQKIEEIEASKNLTELDSFYGRIVETTFEENSARGKFTRWFIKIPDPFTYDQPRTREFFDRVDLVQGTDLERIKQIYFMVTDALPEYGTPGKDSTDLSTRSTFEEILSCNKGICRDYAALLNAALQRTGINSEVIAGPGHTWVRVLNFNDSTGALPLYSSFDLDPTWYKDFVAFTRREKNAVYPLVILAESGVVNLENLEKIADNLNSIREEYYKKVNSTAAINDNLIYSAIKYCRYYKVAEQSTCIQWYICERAELDPSGAACSSLYSEMQTLWASDEGKSNKTEMCENVGFDPEGESCAKLWAEAVALDSYLTQLVRKEREQAEQNNQNPGE
ncbi:MAG: transglutaminase-like domain-containing protein [archaeon]|jgi:hypothetical protein|nr:transglutaminase-like domain-containing protein [archaeon]